MHPNLPLPHRHAREHKAAIRSRPPRNPPVQQHLRPWRRFHDRHGAVLGPPLAPPPPRPAAPPHPMPPPPPPPRTPAHTPQPPHALPPRRLSDLAPAPPAAPPARSRAQGRHPLPSAPQPPRPAAPPTLAPLP